MSGRFVRVAETQRQTFAITVDGVTRQAAVGDTLMVALLTQLLFAIQLWFARTSKSSYCYRRQHPGSPPSPHSAPRPLLLAPRLPQGRKAGQQLACQPSGRM